MAKNRQRFRNWPEYFDGNIETERFDNHSCTVRSHKGLYNSIENGYVTVKTMLYLRRHY